MENDTLDLPNEKHDGEKELLMKNFAIIACPVCDNDIIISEIRPKGNIQCTCKNIIGKFIQIKET